MAERVPIGEIDEFIGEQMRLGRMPGVALSVVRAGEVALERGYGVADVGTREPMTERTGVVIGSTTKALTCTAVMQLAERGLLTLDDPIRRHLPLFQVADARASERMTVRHAITHTAGLPPSAADNPFFLFSDDDADDALERYVASLAVTPLLWPPGAGWTYANDGFVIAGRIVEVLSGLPYEDYMRRNVFEPLGLADTAFSPDERAALMVATPHDYDADGQPYPSFRAHNRASAPAGSQLIMSARDAGRWLRAVLDHTRLDDGSGERLLSEEGYAELLRPQAKISPAGRGLNGADVWYALGWTVATLDGVPTLGHGGATITMGSQFILAPDHRLAIAVVSNSVTDATSINAEGVLSLALGRAPRRSFPRVDPSFQPDRSLWPRLAGAYRALVPQNKVTGVWTIAPDPDREDGRLRVRTYPGDSRRRPGDIFMLPLSDTRFALFGRGRTGGIADFELTTDAGGSVRGVWEGVPIVKES